MAAASNRRTARVRFAAIVVLVGLSAATLSTVPTGPAAADEYRDQYNQASCGSVSPAQYVVPANVHRLTVVASGQAGQKGADADGHGGGEGGLGARVTVSQVPVTPGQTIYSGPIAGGIGSGVYRTDTWIGRGGEGRWVAYDRPDVNCDFSGVELIAVAGGGGGGGDADTGGPGGTGGAAGHDGNPGGDNQAFAGGGGQAGSNSATGHGGSGAYDRNIFGPFPTFMEKQPNGGDGFSIFDGLDPDKAQNAEGTGVSRFGGAGSMEVTPSFRTNAGGGGGGGYESGGGGAASGSDTIGELPGNGAGGGGGGGSFPDFGANVEYESVYSGVSYYPVYDTAIALQASVAPASVGESLTFTATLDVAANQPVPTLGGGRVSFSDNGDPNDPGRQTTSLGSIDVQGSGPSESVSITLPAGFARGTHLISAYFSGFEWPTYPQFSNAPARATFLLHVQSPQTIVFGADPGPQSAYGATYTPTATSTFGLPVSFSIDPASAPVCTISQGVVSFIGGGTCAILADQAGDTLTRAAPQARRELTVSGSIGQAISFTSTPPADFVYGDTYAPTATGGASGQPVTFTSDCPMSGGVLTARVGGTCIITANQAGGNGYSPAASVQQTVVVLPTPSRTVFSSTPPASPEVGDTYLAQAYAIAGADETFAQLSLDAASLGCTLGAPYEVRGGPRFETAALVTYTGIGDCIVNADFAAVQGFIAKAATTQQLSGVEGQPQVITFTSAVPADPTYGRSAPVSAVGGGSGKPVVLASTTPTVCTVDDGTVSFAAAGPCTITANQAGDATTWSAAAQVTRTFTVAPAQLTVTAPNVTFVYGATVAATAPGVSGFVGSDTLDGLEEPPACDRSWTTAHVGSHVTTCSGATDPNYSFSYVAGTATVTPATATVTASSGTTGYGLAIPAVTATVTGLVNGDSALDTAPTCSTPAVIGDPVGSYSTACTGAADADYTIESIAGSMSISAATLVITPSPLVRTYGDGAPTVIPEYVGLLPGDTLDSPPTCTTVVGAQTEVGVYSSSCDDAVDPNYDIGYGTGSVQVRPAALVVSAEASTVYGAPVPALTPSYAGLAGGDLAPQTAAVCSAGATSASPVGDYPITCAAATDPNYSITYVDGVLTVAPAPLTITASSWTSTAGTAIPAITPAYSGLVLGQVAPATAAVCAAGATASSPAGTYPTACTGAADPNYGISYVAGSVTLVAAAAPATPASPGAPGIPAVPSAPSEPRAPEPPMSAPTPAPASTPAPVPSSDAAAPIPADAPVDGPDLTWLWLVLGLIAVAVIASLIGYRRRA